MHIRCPHCQNAIEYLAEKHDTDFTCPSCNSRIDLDGDETVDMVSQTGETVAHFELKELLGTGGFGSVYSARDTKLDRMVAVKLPRYEGMQDQYLKKFFKEARAAAQVKHPNIVAVHEIGQESANGRVYIVSDLVEGVSLSERLSAVQFSPRKCAELAEKVLRGLHKAHEGGIVHRDLKPGNILLDRDDEPYITDFGLAKRFATEITMTARGDILGTPAYMSPEQAKGDAYKADARSDVYSTGVMLYRMLTGKKPFVARESRLLIQQVLKDDPKPPRQINKDTPVDLQTICLKAMEKDPAKRYQTAADMADDLKRYIDGFPIHARPITRVERCWRWAKRNPVLAIAGGVIAGLTVALGLVLAFAEPPELVHTVNIETDPPGAEVAIAPLDPVTRDPIVDQVIRPDQLSPLRVDLRPGDYLIVAKKGDAFHEVLRRVPQSLGDTSGRWSHLKSKVAEDESVYLPVITLFEDPLFLDNSVLINGGEFIMGVDPANGTPPFKRTVDSFRMMQDEVTVGLYKSLNRPLPDQLDDVFAADDFPVGMVSWDLANSCAEQLGGRLPTEAEFEFVATNAGTTTFPWGNDGEVIGEWNYGPVRSIGYDVVPGDQPVYGLYSNWAEWTSSAYYLYPGSSSIPDSASKTYKQDRMVRSGSLNIARGRPENEEDLRNHARRLRQAINHEQRYQHLGFRCVRSEKPRFLP